MAVVCAATLLAAAACSRTKEDLLSNARDVDTRAQLEKALGKPDDIGKLGPIEKWTYNAKNGKVVFIIVGDKVTLETTSKEKEEPKKDEPKK